MDAVNELLSEQTALCATIYEFIEKEKQTAIATRSIGYLEARIQMVKEYWNEFDRNNRKLLMTDTKKDPERSYYKNTKYITIQGIVFEYIGELSETVRRLKIPETVGQAQDTTLNDGILRNQKSQLPRISIPIFDGDYDHWCTFHDHFTTIVHDDPDIKPILKFQHLIGSLRGDAAALIAQYPVTEINYPIAWKVLVDRYQNKRLLVDSRLNLLMSQCTMEVDSAIGVRNLRDVTNQCVESLKNVGVDVKNWDPILIFIITQRLSLETSELWAQRVSEKPVEELPTYKEMLTFLEARFHALELRERSLKVNNPRGQQSKRNNSYALMSTSGVSCGICSKNHSIRQCQVFMEKDLKSKWLLVRKLGLCFNCLAKGHLTNQCTSQSRCSKCKGKHHTRLHRDSNDANQPGGSGLAVHFAGDAPNRGTNVLLATALVEVHAPQCQVHTFRALMDQGSQCSFVTEAVVQSLGLRKRPISSRISGLGKAEVLQSKSLVDIQIGSLIDQDFRYPIEAIVMREITDVLPQRIISFTCPAKMRGMILADPTFDKPGRIDMLLGADVYAAMLRSDVKHFDGIVAQLTIFGWMLSGSVPSQPAQDIAVISMHNRIDLETQLRQFWELEEVQPQTILSNEEVQCEQFFESTHRRDADGRYVTRLPFKNNPDGRFHLGRSKDIAIQRLLQMERRFERNPALKQPYVDCLNEYLTLDHMKLCDDSEIDFARDASKQNTAYDCAYIPHHIVFSAKSTSTKARVVFDASCKTTSGISLNESLMVGPKIQRDLFDTLNCWRKFKVAYTADLEKMYRQVRVEDVDTNYQRIVWREDPKQPIREYRMTRVTFGTASAAYVAVRTVHQLAMDEAQNFPIASKLALDHLYVDDMMAGADTVEEAIIAKSQLISMFASGGFNLTKWTSNNAELLETIPIEHRELKTPLSIEVDQSIRALGVEWHPSNDRFKFVLRMKDTTHLKLTKRVLLSEISKLFDPSGWISPVIIVAKIMMQQLWTKKLTWDEELPTEVVKNWKDFREALNRVGEISIPRWIGTNTKMKDCQMHGFADSSEAAYAAVIYLRVVDMMDNIAVFLLCSKTKVAPLKKVTLPRLELCGANLMMNLIARLVQSMRLSNTNLSYFAWSDSQIVLAWLKDDPRRWLTFVQNREADIHRIGEKLPTSWNYIQSNQNPADCATRGMNPAELMDHQLWWSGPDLLHRDRIKEKPNDFITDFEARKVFLSRYVMADQLLVRYSSLSKLLRAVAYLNRFKWYLQKKWVLSGSISSFEWHQSRIACFKCVQMTVFYDEISALVNDDEVSNHSNIYNLNPVLIDGVLRVGGRLRNADLPIGQKHPIILPNNHHFTALIIAEGHVRMMHGGIQLVMSELRREFWIPRMRMAVRRCIKSCIICTRHEAKVMEQQMGNLPIPRIRISRPFTNSGVDYAGPIDIRISKGRGNRSYKGYIALFICMVTKAVHIEAVSDLTTQAFLAAFRRFTARRGLCANMYSDNGTCFVGANRKLKQDHDRLMRNVTSEITPIVAKDGVTWHFIPPRASHFGGLWEAGIKSTKFHLKRVIGASTLTFEEMSTLLAQIECILNSRPLCPLSNDPEDLSSLTPGHFLAFGSLNAVPEPSLLDRSVHGIHRWEIIQRMVQQFWKRWSAEYLNRLMHRPKWVSKKANINVGNLVLLKDENLPPSKWMMGRVLECHPGNDGLVRAVTLKTEGGSLKRPIAKLCLLPTDVAAE